MGMATRQASIPRWASPVEPGFDPRPTTQQRRTLGVLGVAEASVRHAAVGRDVFAYVEDDHSTLRLQIAPDGCVVGQTVLNRGPHEAPRQEV
jgi:hypothetical protein